jgi:hypothetical protein
MNIDINGQSLKTPIKASSITLRNLEELQPLLSKEYQAYTGLGEIHISLTSDKIDRCLEDEESRIIFDREISNRLQTTLQLGLIPYLLISVKDNKGFSLNSLPAEEELKFIINLLWHPLNTIVVPPMFGGLKSMKEYEHIMRLLKERFETSQDKFIIASIPSIYRSITPNIIKNYWKFGVRMYAIDLDGRTLGAQSSIITLIHFTLNQLRKESDENYILGGFNVKENAGVGDTARAHSLLSTAYGLDFFGGNHVRRVGWAGDKPKRSEVLSSIRFLQSSDYGFYNVLELLKLKHQSKNIEIDTLPFKDTSLESVKYYTEQKVRSISKIHNLLKIQSEVKKFLELIETDKFIKYLNNKNRIQRDLPELSKVVNATKTQKAL